MSHQYWPLPATLAVGFNGDESGAGLSCRASGIERDACLGVPPKIAVQVYLNDVLKSCVVSSNSVTRTRRHCLVNDFGVFQL
jgi:hypothetical protein